MSTNPIRVLLIEDEAGDANLVKIALQKSPEVRFDLTWVESLAAAKQALIESRFDVILLDLTLPDSDGLRSVEVVRQIACETPIIVLTGHIDLIEFALTILKAGATDYTSKEIINSREDGLVRVIRYALLREELEANNKLLAAANLSLDLLRTLNDVAVVTESDLQGRIIFINEQFSHLSGYSEQETLGATHAIMNSGTHPKEFFANMWAVIQRGQAWSGEVCGRKKSGDLYWMQTIVFPVFREKSVEAYKYAMLGLDITEKKKREQAMQNRAALYDAAIETTDGFCRISSSGQFLEVSEGYCQLSGYERDDLLTMNILNMTGDFELSSQQFSVIIQGNGKTFEIEQRRKDDSVWRAEVTASYSTLNDGSLFVFLHDITERLEMQKRDKILRDQINQMQKVDSIGRLTAGIGHDFNNILTGILGFNEMCQIVSEDLPADDLKIDLAHNLAIAGKRAVELIAKMMTYCRQNAENVDVEKTEISKPTAQVITEVVEMVRPGLTNKFKIELALNENLQIFIDSIDLHQVMTNLLVNARDAMKLSGGIINIQLTTFHIVEGLCTACLMPIKGDFIALSVSDNGSGIDQKVIEQIFDPFFTTKKVNEGTGLGLSTVSGIVHHARGHIVIDSELGTGTTFKLLFSIK
jgi:PAS domain S-box-containing protein